MYSCYAIQVHVVYVPICCCTCRMEETDSLQAHSTEVVQLREKVTYLEEQVSTERRRKESCQGEIERLSRQLRLAECKPNHWEEAAQDIHTPKHQRQRKGSKDGSSSVSVDAEGIVGDGAIEVHVQMAELRGRNSELHSRVVSLEHERQVMSKTLDERNIVIEALQKELVASKISLVSTKSGQRIGSQPTISSRFSVLSPSQVSSPQHGVAASSVSLTVPPAPPDSSCHSPSLSSAPLPQAPALTLTTLPHDATALRDHLLIVLKDLRSKEEALGKCQEELEQFRRKFSVIIHQQVSPTIWVWCNFCWYGAPTQI